MQNFLVASSVVDFDHRAVRGLSESLRQSGPAESYALRCFEWVKHCVQHSQDCGSDVVSCSASEVAMSRVGLCYAKSHLLVALLRAGQIPAGFSYQRFATDSGGFCLHGLVSVFIESVGWHRIDPRGGEVGAAAKFAPPVESLVYCPSAVGEMDIPEVFDEPLPVVVIALKRYSSMKEVLMHLPDYVLPNQSLEPMARSSTPRAGHESRRLSPWLTIKR